MFNIHAITFQPERVDFEPSMSGAERSYDIRSDVWSFGISMIEISTGKYPYNTMYFGEWKQQASIKA